MTTHDSVFDPNEWPARCPVQEASHDPHTILRAHRLVHLVEEPITVSNIQEVERIARGISYDMIARL